VLAHALNVDLMLETKEQALVDTLLNDMAHAEAWLMHGHRGHGGVWRAIARRVGCEARACSDMRIRRRRRNTDLTRVPLLPAARLL
jgi:predicted SprT family Zn-dependent metalloprotease